MTEHRSSQAWVGAPARRDENNRDAAATSIDSLFALAAHATATGDTDRLEAARRGLAGFDPLTVTVRAVGHLRRWDEEGTVTFEQVRWALKELGTDAATLRTLGSAITGRSATQAVDAAVTIHGDAAVYDAVVRAVAAAMTRPDGLRRAATLGLGDADARSRPTA